MTTWKILVWTRFRSEPSPIVARCLDPRHVRDALPRGIRWTPSDVDATHAALRTGSPNAVASSISLPFSTIDWPLHIDDLAPDLRVTTSTVNPWFRQFIHRRRFERALGGHTRYVDELLIEPAKGWPTAVAHGVKRTFVTMHRNLANNLPADPNTIGSARMFRLDAAKAGHAEALLDGFELR